MKQVTFLLLIILGFTQISFSQINWTVYNDSNSEVSPFTYSNIKAGEDGKIYAGGSFTGLTVFNGTSWTHYFSFFNDLYPKDINEIVVADNNDVWLGTGDGIVIFDGVDFTSLDSSVTNLPGSNIFTMGKNVNGDIWISSGEGSFTHLGLTVYDGTNWTNLIGFPTQLEYADFFDFAFKPNGDVWIATDPGISKYDGFFTYYPSSITGLNSSKCIAIDDDGNVWAGGRNGLLKYDGSDWTFIDNAVLGFPENMQYYDIYPIGNYIWIGTAKGLVRFNRITQIIEEIYDSSNSPLDDVVLDIELDSDGALWLVDLNNGVIKMEYTASGLSSNSLNSLVNIYPNPFENQIQVTVDGVIDNIEVVDVVGRTQTIRFVDNVLYLEDISSGIYFLKMKIEGQTVVEKIIKK